MKNPKKHIKLLTSKLMNLILLWAKLEENASIFGIPTLIILWAAETFVNFFYFNCMTMRLSFKSKIIGINGCIQLLEVTQKIFWWWKKQNFRTLTQVELDQKLPVIIFLCRLDDLFVKTDCYLFRSGMLSQIKKQCK